MGGPSVSPLFGLCVANPSSVPLLFWIQRTVPHYALWTCLRFTVWDFPGKQRKWKVGEDACFEPFKYLYLTKKKSLVWSPLAQVSLSCCSYVGWCNVREFVPLTGGTVWLKKFVAWLGSWISLLQVQANALDCLFCFPVWPWKISTRHQFI